jgi:hypothetical protein
LEDHRTGGLIVAHKVIVPLVVATQEDGTHVYLYEGAPVPASVGEAEIARLGAEGFIADEEVLRGFPAGDPGEAWTIPQLRKYAEVHNVDLGDAKKHDEILTALA